MTEVPKHLMTRITDIVIAGSSTFTDRQPTEFLPLNTMRKQEVCLFKLSNSSDLMFAYRKLTNPAKANEYAKCLKLQGLDIGFPTIYYFNPITMEVVNEWLEGEKLCYFERSREEQPEVSPGDLCSIVSLVLKLHRHHSEEFTGIEFLPRTHLWPDDEVMKPKRLYPNWFQGSYLLGNTYETSKERCQNISEVERREVEYLFREGSQVLTDGQQILSEVGSFSLLHGDLHAENVIRTSAGIRLIDFENLHYGDRAIELAYLIEHGFQGGYITSKNLEWFVGEYCRQMVHADHGITDEHLTSRLRVIRVAISAKLLKMLSAGYTSPHKSYINRPLFEDVYSRTKMLLSREI